MCLGTKNISLVFSHDNEMKDSQMPKLQIWRKSCKMHKNFLLIKSRLEQNETNNFKIIENKFVCFKCMKGYYQRESYIEKRN